MAVSILKIKILPESPETNLEDLETKVRESLEKAGAVKINSVEQEEIAFGLKALVVTFAWPEDKETEEAENACKVQGVSSVQVIDYRRAFG